MKFLNGLFSRPEGEELDINNIIELKNYEHFEEITKKDNLLFIYFHRKKCNTCHQTNKIVNSLKKKLSNNNIQFIFLNPEISFHLKIYKKFNVRYTPRYIIFKKNIVVPVSELTNIKNIEEQIKKHL
jgi:hypothetical protein